jgi:hypothetical protein
VVTAVADHRAVLRGLPPEEWDIYLAANSGLPGPRANLELLHAVADEADPARIRRYAASPDEYEGACGAVGLGRLLAAGDDHVLLELMPLACDERWRVREGVAMALQRLGDAHMPALLAVAADWAGGGPLLQRAALAGVCEPRFLAAPEVAEAVLDLVDRVTASLIALASGERRRGDVRVLRQALGYCWSVAVAALPVDGFARLERWADLDDPDARWIVRENLKKARLSRADAPRTQQLRARLAELAAANNR